MPSLFPDLEPAARAVAETYVSESKRLGFVGMDGNGTPSKAHLKEIGAGARDYVEAIGEKPELLRRTIRKMRKAGLIIASPRSCIKVARQESQWEEPSERDRYVGGEFADAVRH